MQVGGLPASGADVSRLIFESPSGSGPAGEKRTPPPTGENATVVDLSPSGDRRVRFHYDFHDQEIYVQVVDGHNGEVLRQIPDQKYRRLIGRLQDLVETYLMPSR